MLEIKDKEISALKALKIVSDMENSKRTGNDVTVESHMDIEVGEIITEAVRHLLIEKRNKKRARKETVDSPKEVEKSGANAQSRVRSKKKAAKVATDGLDIEMETETRAQVMEGDLPAMPKHHKVKRKVEATFTQEGVRRSERIRCHRDIL
eukprot:Colp12_sorted_trinity150504_noHs@28636